MPARPTIIRNVTYNCPSSAIKFSGAEGSLFYNNTFTCKMSASAGSNFQSINNLWLNQNAGETMISMTTFTNYSMLDYNGYRPNDTVPGMAAPAFAQMGLILRTTSRRTIRVRNLITDTFPTLAAFQAGTGQDAHSRLIDWNVFTNAAPPGPPVLHYVAGL